MTKKQLGILIKCCISVACSIGLISNCIGIFYTPMAESLITGRGQIAVISTIISIASALTGPIVAKLIKKYPIHIVMSIGVLLTALGMVLLSFIRVLPILYVIAAVIGIGAICFKNLTVSIVLRSWFGSKSASKLGIAMAMTGVVAAVMNPVLSSIIEASSYETAFRVLALIIAVLGLPAVYTIRLGDADAPKPVPAAEAVDGASGADAIKAEAPQKTQIPMILMIMMTVLMPITIAGATGMNTHFSSYAVTLGYTLGFGATVVSFQSIFNSVWKLVYGILAERIGSVKSCVIYLAFTILSCVMLIVLTKVPAGIILGVSLFPMAFSVSTVGMPTIIQEVSRERFADVFATANMVQSIGYALFTSIYGMISDKAGVYLPCLILVIVCAGICGAVCVIITRKAKIK